MSTRKKIISFTFLGLVLGIIVGVIATVFFIVPDMVKSMFMLQEYEFIRNEDTAIEAYLNEPPEIGIWALQNYINSINQALNDRGLEKAHASFFLISPKNSLGFAHARLALLYEKKGDELKKDEHTSKAFEYIKSAAINSEEKLFQLVITLDENHKLVK